MSAAATIVGGAPLAGSPIATQAVATQVPSQDENSTMPDEFLASGLKVKPPWLPQFLVSLLCHSSMEACRPTCSPPDPSRPCPSSQVVSWTHSRGPPPANLWSNLDVFRNLLQGSRSRKRSTLWQPPSYPARTIIR